MSSVNRDSFIFLICMPFISFFCLAALARISSITLGRSDESGHPCLFPDLRLGRTFSLTSKCNVSRRFFVNALYQPEEISLCFCFFESTRLGVGFFQMLFFIKWYDM